MCAYLDHEACPLSKADLSSLDFVINRFFMKLFKTSNVGRGHRNILSGTVLL